jgi:hypothetical protein
VSWHTTQSFSSRSESRRRRSACDFGTHVVSVSECTECMVLRDRARAREATYPHAQCTPERKERERES